MKCLFPGINVKIFGRAIHALAKIGDELFIEGSPDGLVLRSINWAESAYCMITFRSSFFTFYKYNHVVNEDDEGLTCKISMKSALNVFKSPNHMDRQVEVCEIKLDPDSSKLVFLLRCKHGIVKTHLVSILECKKMEATYSKEDVSNRFSISNKTLSEAVSSFQLSEDQITFEVTDQLFRIRNYTDDASDPSKISRTQLTLKPGEFSSYDIGTNTTITFAMREFRAVFTFAEALNLPISCCFETTGKPAIFSVQNTTTFEADFVMATERSDGATQSSANTTQHNRKTMKRVATNSFNDTPQSSKKRSVSIENNNQLDEDADLFSFVHIPNDDELLNNSKAPDRSKSPEIPMDFEVPNSPVMNTQVRTIRNVFKRCFENTILPSSATLISDILASGSETEDGEDNV